MTSKLFFLMLKLKRGLSTINAMQLNRVESNILLDILPRPERDVDDCGEEERKGVECIEVDLDAAQEISIYARGIIDEVYTHPHE